MSIVIQHEFTTQQLADALSPEALTEALLLKIKAPATTPSMPPKLGAVWAEQGGFYIGLVRGENGPDYHLIAAPTDIEKPLEWGPTNVIIEGAQNFRDGLANTLAIISSEGNYPAAAACRAFVQGERDDWYLPARHELRMAYLNAPESFDTSTWYWSSTQYAGYASFAWSQFFDGGSQSGGGKGYQGRVRAVRRFLID